MSQRKKGGGWSRLPGSAKVKIDKLIAGGWKPRQPAPSWITRTDQEITRKAGPRGD